MAVYVAYSLAIQAIIASVGLGMSAAATADRADPILCSFAFNQIANAPVRDDNRQKPSPAPQCPFCFIAAQSAGHIAILTYELDQQARELAAVFTGDSVTGLSSSSDIGAARPVIIRHAHLG